MLCKAKVNFFKTSGKWYDTDEYSFPRDISRDKLYDNIKEHYKNKYKDMHLVVTNFGAYDLGFPMMIPAEFR